MPTTSMDARSASATATGADPSFAQRGQAVWRGIVLFSKVVWRVLVVIATPVIGIAGALLLAGQFAAWLRGANVEVAEIWKTIGLAASGAAIFLKVLKEILTYAKEGWQYIQGNMPTFDPDKYAISILIACLGFALLLNSGRAGTEVATLEVTARTPKPAVSIGPVAFAPTFYFAQAKLVEKDGVEIVPGVQVQREAVEPIKDYVAKLGEFVTRILECSKLDGVEQRADLEVFGFASDAQFFDPGAQKARDDSDPLNLAIANIRAERTAAELTRAIEAANKGSVITAKAVPWSSLGDMRKRRAEYDNRLLTYWNSSMDQRAAIVEMKKNGRVCPGQAYGPNFRMLEAAH